MYNHTPPCRCPPTQAIRTQPITNCMTTIPYLSVVSGIHPEHEGRNIARPPPVLVHLVKPAHDVSLELWRVSAGWHPLEGPSSRHVLPDCIPIHIPPVVMPGHALVCPPLCYPGQLIVPDHLLHIQGCRLSVHLPQCQHLPGLIVLVQD